MIRRLLATSTLTAITLLGCNALLGVDDGAFLDPDAGSRGDAGPGTPDVDNPAPREPLEITMRKSALRVPRGERSTMVFDIGGFDAPNDPVTLEVATPLPTGFVYEDAHGDVKVATLTISASAAAETPTVKVAVTFRRGASSKVVDLQLRSGRSGTPDEKFGSGGVLELNAQGESDTPILATETRGDLMTVESSAKPVVGRYDDTGLRRAAFWVDGGATLDVCEARRLLAQDDAVLVLASCGGTTRLYEVDGLGKVTVRGTQLGRPLGLAAMDAGIRVVTSSKTGQVEVHASDGGLVGTLGTSIDPDSVAVTASGERFLFGVPADGPSGTSFALNGGDAGRDPTWGTDGTAQLPGFGLVTANDESFDSVTATPTAGGGALFAGIKTGDTSVSVATLLSATGTPLTFTLSGTADAVSAVAQDAAGRFVVARYDADLAGNPYLERYTTTGALDTTFGDGGRADLLVSDFTPNTLAFDSDGLILVGGYATADTVMRFWP